MENREILKEERAKRFWRCFRIGAAAGVILSLLGYSSILLSGLISPYLIIWIYDTISLPARTLCNIFGAECFPYLLSSAWLVLLVNPILLGLAVAVGGLLLSRKRSKL